MFSTTKDSWRTARIKRPKSVFYVQTFIWPLVAFYSKLLGEFFIEKIFGLHKIYDLHTIFSLHTTFVLHKIFGLH